MIRDLLTKLDELGAAVQEEFLLDEDSKKYINHQLSGVAVHLLNYAVLEGNDDTAARVTIERFRLWALPKPKARKRR